jgi:glycosyltransferase involved in cell wall biosynthesis
MKLSIIIPVFNEVSTIKKILSRVKKVKLSISKEIIIIDDCSTDGTKELIKKIKRVKKFYHKKNYGKGASLKTGISNSTGDIILIQDADLEYSPEDYKKLIEPIIQKKSKVVYGSRLLKKNNQGKFIFYLGGLIVTKVTNFLYNSNLTDEPTCYKVFHKDLKKILISARGNRFDWEPEVTAKILKKGIKIYEVPINYNPRTKEFGKKIGFKDGIQAIWVLFKWKLKSN